MKKEKTLLERSHSKWSNFKLTLITFMISLIVSSIWIVVAFKNYLKPIIFYITLPCLFLVLILFFYFIKKFKR